MFRPYKDTIITENVIIREFDKDIDSNEMKWHTDLESRTIETIENTNWQIQFDNQLPILLENSIHIPKGVYHRVIKGDGNLKIKINKHA